MRFSFHAVQTLSRHFLIAEVQEALPCAEIARRLTGRKSGLSAEGVIFYECERTVRGECLLGASYYTSSGTEEALSADGARALAAYLLEREPNLPLPLRILCKGEIICVTAETASDGGRTLAVTLPSPSFDPERVGLISRTPLLGQRVPVGTRKIPVYALSLGIPHAVILELDTPLEHLRLASIALPLSVGRLFSRPFRCVFAEQTAHDAFAARIFDSELGELDASSEGAGATATVLHLLGLAPTACPLRAAMRGGALSVCADHLGAPLSIRAEGWVCFEGATELVPFGK